ncbi:ABC transporter ATP-binding protein [Streptococcus pneumoniae]|nr:ABC transporter ATP-binding protein [Streptococcus pneumoniae]
MGDDFTSHSLYLLFGLSRVGSADLYLENTDLLGSQGTNLDELWQPASMMMGMPFLAFLSVVAVGFFASRVAASYTSRLRSDIFNRVLDYSQTEIKKFSIPSLLMRTTNDITQV